MRKDIINIINIKIILMLLLIIFTFNFLKASPSVTHVNPLPNKHNVTSDSIISATFDVDIDSTTLNMNTIKVVGSFTGIYACKFKYNASNRTVVITPDSLFKTGEIVSITITRGVKSSSGDSLSSPFLWQFSMLNNKGSGKFLRKIDIGVNNDPSNCVTSDFDNDGNIDIAVSNWGSNNVSILLNNSNGSFVISSNIAVNINPSSLAPADFNNDGNIDLAMSYWGSNNISILINNGKGNFSYSSDVKVNSKSRSITSTDFDGDGNIDLAVANTDSNNVSILINNGSGSFSKTSDIRVNLNPISVISADFDGDGDMDIAVVNNGSNNVSILINNGSGSFSKTSDIGVNSYPMSITSADFDDDGDIDLAVANNGSNNVSILINNGSGSFSKTSDVEANSYPCSVTSTDFDGDGDMDMAVANAGSDNVSILINNGSGSFSKTSDIGVNSNPRSVTSADFDGDGDMDLVVANKNSDDVSILSNRNKEAYIKLLNNYLNFGTLNIGNSKELYIKIYNDCTDSTLRIINITNRNNTFKIDKTTLNIPPESTDSIKITFTPMSTGAYIDSIEINSNAINQPNIMVNLSGKCVILLPPSISNVSSSNCQIIISWYKSTDTSVLNYRVYFGTTNNPTKLLKETSSENDTSVVITSGLINNTTYYFRVTAINSFAESNYSGTISLLYKCNQNKILTIFKTSDKITIDGIYNEQSWQQAKTENIEQSIGKVDGLSANFKMCYDEKNIYVLVSVTDPTPNVDGITTWNSDNTCLYLAMDTLNSTSYRTGDWQIRKVASKSQNDGGIDGNSKNLNALLSDPNFKVEQVDGATYVQEWQLPISTLATNANFNGQWFRFDIQITDNDGTSNERTGQLFWNSNANDQDIKIKNHGYIYMKENILSNIKPYIFPVNDICPDSFVTLNLKDPISWAQYTWYEDDSALNITSQDNIKVKLRYDKKYTVKEEISGNVSDPLNIIWNTMPDVTNPKIYVGGGPEAYYFATDSKDSTKYKYQWYVNDSPIKGANKYYYIAGKNYGTYYLKLSQTGKECPSFSSKITINNNSGKISDNHTSINLYPNPAHNEINIKIYSEYKGKLNVQISDLIGRILFSNIIEKSDYNIIVKIPVNNYATGYYIVKLKELSSEPYIFYKK